MIEMTTSYTVCISRIKINPRILRLFTLGNWVFTSLKNNFNRNQLFLHLVLLKGPGGHKSVFVSINSIQYISWQILQARFKTRVTESWDFKGGITS